MQIWLGDFRLWRIKQLFAFFLCFSGGILLAVFYDNGVFLLFGIILYGILIEIPFFKTKELADVYVEHNKICIVTKKKEVKIEIKEIVEVKIKEIRYGGKWLDTIGYRLAVITNNHKYYFDSTFLNENDNHYDDIKKLQKMIKQSIEIDV